MEVIYIVQPHEDQKKGTLGLNKLQRQDLGARRSEKLETEEIEIEGLKKETLRTIEIEVASVSANKGVGEFEGTTILKEFRYMFNKHMFHVGQTLALKVEGRGLKFTVMDFSKIAEAVGEKSQYPEYGYFEPETTEIALQAKKNGGIKVTGLISQNKARDIFIGGEQSFEKLGIGGLAKQLSQIFRRAFASRIYPPEVIAKMGINHVRGIILYGPPGTGKTLMARKIGKLLNAREPKIVNGPDILNKFVGESEKNIRDLFKDAEDDYEQNGEEADLHLIIFDEIDAICKQRGTTGSSTGVNDSVVNQLLSKIDGVNTINNILVIGMTNRLDMLDEALLRPGRFEVQVEINLPNEEGRHQIFRIHTEKLRANNVLESNVNLEELARDTKNYSGAEIEAVVKSACSFALNRRMDLHMMSQKEGDTKKNQPISLNEIKVGKMDFVKALREVKPAFGISENTLEAYVADPFVLYSETYKNLYESVKQVADNVRESETSEKLSMLLTGAAGTGKTALAVEIARLSEFPFIKLISPDTMVGYSETAKVNAINKVFNDAYKTPLSVIVLDDIERLIDYVNVGPRFSNPVLQALSVLVKKKPPKGKRLLVIGTSTDDFLIQRLGLGQSFDLIERVEKLDVEAMPTLFTEHGIPAKVVTEFLTSNETMQAHAIPIKSLLLMLEMAITNSSGNEVTTKDLTLATERVLGYLSKV